MGFAASRALLSLAQISSVSLSAGSSKPARDTLPSANTATLQPVFYATNREITDGEKPLVERITYDRSRDLKYGLAIVSVPRAHLIGNIERPKFNYFRWAYEPERNDKHFVLKPLAPLTREALIDGLGAGTTAFCCSCMVTIQVFATPFLRLLKLHMMQISRALFLPFPGPSAGALMGYDYDSVSAGFSTGDLLQLIRLVTQDAGGKRIYVVAHSMGNQIVTNALVQANLSKVDLGISELVMAAPDVDKDTFFKVADDIKSVVRNVTMYASSADKALLASEKKSWHPAWATLAHLVLILSIGLRRLM